MISYSELVYSVLIAFLYLLILPFQLVIFPSTYYSVRDIIYSKNLKSNICSGFKASVHSISFLCI